MHNCTNERHYWGTSNSTSTCLDMYRCYQAWLNYEIRQPVVSNAKMKVRRRTSHSNEEADPMAPPSVARPRTTPYHNGAKQRWGIRFAQRMPQLPGSSLVCKCEQMQAAPQPRSFASCTSTPAAEPIKYARGQCEMARFLPYPSQGLSHRAILAQRVIAEVHAILTERYTRIWQHQVARAQQTSSRCPARSVTNSYSNFASTFLASTRPIAIVCIKGARNSACHSLIISDNAELKTMCIAHVRPRCVLGTLRQYPAHEC